MVINSQICWCKISFTLYGACLEKDNEWLRRHAQFSYCYQQRDVNFWKNKNTPVSSDSFLHRQRLKIPVKYQSPYSPVCANLALQGNFWHMYVTNQTHSRYSAAVLAPSCNPHGSLLGTESIRDFKWTALPSSWVRSLWWVSQGKGGHGQSSAGCWPFMDSGISINHLESLLTNPVSRQGATMWTRSAWRWVEAILVHTSCCD